MLSLWSLLFLCIGNRRHLFHKCSYLSEWIKICFRYFFMNSSLQWETRQFTDNKVQWHAFWRQFTDKIEDKSPTLLFPNTGVYITGTYGQYDSKGYENSIKEKAKQVKFSRQRQYLYHWLGIFVLSIIMYGLHAHVLSLKLKIIIIWQSDAVLSWTRWIHTKPVPHFVAKIPRPQKLTRKKSSDGTSQILSLFRNFPVHACNIKAHQIFKQVHAKRRFS